jgi:hypothetical protein
MSVMLPAEVDPDLNKRFLEQLNRRAIDQGFQACADGKIAPRGDKHDNLRFPSGLKNVVYHFRISRDCAPYVSVSIYDARDRPRNRVWFEELSRSRGAIEDTLGTPLEWEYEPSKNLGAYIRYQLDADGSPANPAEWSRLQDAMIDAVRRLYEAVQPHLDAMPAELRQPT